MLSTNLVVADKEMAREILVKQFNNFPDRRSLEGFNGDIDNSLLVTKGEQWKHDRSIISPTFSSGKIRKMAPLIQKSCETLIETCRNAMKSGNDGQVEIKELFGGYTMDVISSTAFGIHIDSQGNPDDPFIRHAKRLFDFTIMGTWILLAMLFPPIKHILIRCGIYALPRDSMDYFRQFTSRLIEERKRNKKEGRSDFLQLMIDSQEESQAPEGGESSTDPKESKTKLKGMSFEGILANAEVFFVAGYETTSVTLTMLAYNLATNPDCQERLRQEIEEEIGSKMIDYDNIQKLHYLDMCLSETLRIYPPALRIERTCIKTTKVKDITIPAGMVVTIPVYAMHHDPDVWDKPDVFNPERFSASEKANHDPFDYIPFGYGPRNCIGMRLALLKAKMATAYIIRSFRLCVGSRTDIPPKMDDSVNLKPISSWLKMEEIK
ncbi:cytochrome P450 3A11-like isoform X2 [Ylistrum balloti]|nr:cytochrome P450 3A11-like isoform X2 [Ylistrum balloti]